MNAIVVAHPSNTWSAHQVALIRKTVAADCNDAEFDLFVTVARNAGLDPFRRQITAIVFSKSDATKRRMSIITGIDGLRVIAARSRRYRPDENEPQFEIDPDLKSPSNPVGLVKAVVKVHIADDRREGGWRPVSGVAYWDEFAPIKEEASEGYDWVDTGETWPDTGKPKKRKIAREGSTIVRQLDTSGQWPKMPRVMLAKCAEAQALRKAFPEDLSALYESAELDRAQADDLSPSETVAALQTQDRLARVGAIGILFQLFPNGPLESIPLGQVADRVIETVKAFSVHDQIRWFESANLQPLREFWARSPGDALEVKKVIEACGAKLLAEVQDPA